MDKLREMMLELITSQNILSNGLASLYPSHVMTGYRAARAALSAG